MVYVNEVTKQLDIEQPKQEKQTLLSKYDIPVQHLDFGYIKQCNDGKELERILKILQSHEEGYYPELIKETEKRLSIVKPNSKLLRETTTVLSTKELDIEEQKKVTYDIDEFLSRIKIINKELESLKRSNIMQCDAIPNVRQAKPFNENNNRQATRRIKSTDYESWDKYDPDTEILKMELEEEKMKKQAEKENKQKPRIEPVEQPKHFATEAEAELEAQKEKLKGNEFFKNGDYDYAIAHYTKSINAKPTAPCYTNRALCYIKLKKYNNAAKDCQEALTFDANNIKAHLRLAECFERLKNYQSAIKHIDTALRIEPNNPTVQKLAKLLDKYRETANGKKTRLKIDDISTSDVKSNKQENKTKKSTALDDYTIIPYVGTSKMPPPYCKVVRNDQIKNHKIYETALRRPELIHLTVIDDSSDDDDSGVSNIQNRSFIEKQKQAAPSGIVIREITENEQNKLPNNTPAAKVVQNEESIAKNQVFTDKQQILLNDKGGGGEPCVTGIAPEAVSVEDLNSPYSFLKSWNSISKDTSYIKHAEILKNLNTGNLQTVIGNKLDSKMLSDVLKCMRLHSRTVLKANKIQEILEQLTQIPRFNIIQLFLTKADKDNFTALADFLSEEGRYLDEKVKKSFMF